MRDIEHAKMMLSLASEEMEALRIMEVSPSISPRIFGFHAQQIVEKTLKAWLSLLGVTYPMTHSLNVLFVLVEDQVGPDAQNYRDLESLTPYAVQFRYGAYIGPSDELDRPRVVSRSNELLEFVRSLVESA